MIDSLQLFAIPEIPEIKPGDDLASIIVESAQRNEIILQDNDILVIAQKVVSKSEGCIFKKDDIRASEFAEKLGEFTGHSPEYMELVLRNSKRIVRMTNGIVITQSNHGFIMANAGVDSSNSGGKDCMITLPSNPDKSALIIKRNIKRITGNTLAVIISDTFGRPWRNGQINVAIGVAGLEPIKDYRGEVDNDGREMKATQIAVADELASAAELLSGKTNKLPIVVIRGYEFETSKGNAAKLIMDHKKNIFK